MRTSRAHTQVSAPSIHRDKEPASNPASRPLSARLSAVALTLPLIFVLLVAASLAQPASAAHVIHGTVTRLAADQASSASSISNDWAGYAASGETYTRVAGSWKQPSVNCSDGPDSYAAFWIGLDGYMSRTVEQIGTDSDCAQGTSAYYAWYEMFPAYPVTLSHPVAAGDALSASVTSNGSGAFTLTISDATQQWTYTTNQTSSRAELGSAEWIAESPSNGRHTLPLADFGSVTFTSCTANGASIAHSPTVDEIVLGAPYVGIEAQPSTLSQSGTSFSVTAPSLPTGTGTGAGSTSPYPTEPNPTPPTQPYPWSHHHHWHDSGSGSSGSSSWWGSYRL